MLDFVEIKGVPTIYLKGKTLQYIPYTEKKIVYLTANGTFFKVHKISSIGLRGCSTIKAVIVNDKTKEERWISKERLFLAEDVTTKINNL